MRPDQHVTSFRPARRARDGYPGDARGSSTPSPPGAGGNGALPAAGGAAARLSPGWAAGALRGLLRLPGLVVALQVLGLVCYVGVMRGWIPGAGAGLVLAAVLTGTTVTCALAAWRERARRAAWWAWALLAAAHVAVGVVLAVSVAHNGPASAGPPSWPDAEYAVYYPPVLVATWLLVRSRTPPWLPSMWWDAVVVTLGAGAAASTALWLLRPPAGFGAHHGVGILAPVADAVLVTVILSVASLSGARVGPGPWLVSAGLCAVAFADAAHLHLSPAGHQGTPRAIDLGWLAGYTLIGLSTGAAVPQRRPRERRHRPPDLARAALLPWTVTLLSVLLLVVALAGGPVPRASALLALGSVALTLARIALAPAGLQPGAGPDTGTDELTGLADRRALSRALASDGALAESGRAWSRWTDRVALLLVDIDRFKEINEALGHPTGDLVLTEVGARFQGVLREGQLLARLGGDEFAVVLPGAGPEPARRVADQLLGVLAEPFSVLGDRLPVRASIGIASCQLRRGEPADLLRRADVAMYRAKAAGTGVELYDPDRDRVDAVRLRRTAELRAALERGDLEVHLQPQIDLAKGTVVGAEALARWRHPHDGVLLPASFLPLAAQTGLMHPVAALVLDRALSACAQWWSRGHLVPVSVNLNARDLHDEAATDLLLSTLQRHGLPPAALCVEITEDVMLEDPAATAALLHDWRNRGVSIALDDFGSGYSALAYLRVLPLDELKLDRVFASDLRNRRAATVVRHAVALAHALRLRVVAEGVEDEATARLLADGGCDVGQGLYFGDAMDVPAFLSYLDAQQP